MNLVRIISLSLVTKSYLQISEGKLNIQVQAINGIAFSVLILQKLSFSVLILLKPTHWSRTTSGQKRT